MTFETDPDQHSTPTFALLNDANPTLVQKLMRHQHYAESEIYIEEVQRLLDGAEDEVTEIQTGSITLKASVCDYVPKLSLMTLVAGGRTVGPVALNSPVERHALS